MFELDSKTKEYLVRLLAENNGSVGKNVTQIRLSSEEIANNNEMLLKSNSDREKVVGEFFAQLQAARNGINPENKTKEAVPQNISFSQGINAFFGKSVNDFLNDIEIFPDSDTLQSATERMGYSNLDKVALQKMLIDYSNLGFNQFMNTKDVDPTYRFLIPELILQAIRVGYEGSARHLNWVRGTQNVSKKKITAPHIKDGDVMPSRISEGAAIPFGTLQFGQKEVQVFKVGVGFDMTDELIDQSSLNLMNVFIAQVGVKMSIGADVEAIRVLVNGDQAGGAESAPVIGVDTTASGITHFDMDNIMMQMEMLNQPASRLIARKAELIRDLNASLTNRDRETVKQYANVPADAFLLPANQVMFVNVLNAMMKLQYKSLMVEMDRDIQTQKERLFITDHIGFMNIKRDARVILDRSVTNVASPFPAYMDIEAYLNTAFKTN